MRYAVIAISGKPARFAGFLHSIACEIAPGVFVAHDLNRRSFERIWQIMESWSGAYPEGWIVALIPKEEKKSIPEILTLGIPRRHFTSDQDVILMKVEAGTKSNPAPENGSS